MGLTVKGTAATSEQQHNMLLCCQIGRQMGATPDRLAGAIATMIQESAAVNLKGGDRDSAGLYQQRPSCNWGTYAQVTEPAYAIRAFMTPYLNYCKQGMGVIEASNKVQGSAYPQAPAQWLAESTRNVQLIMGSSDFSDVTAPGGASISGGYNLKSTTRVEPYEFSRGTSSGAEDSWTCIGRLAEEVKWDRFMRAGVLWFVSEDWLAKQPPRFVFSEGARGVLAITFSNDVRHAAAEATVTVLADRWAVQPGDAVRIKGQGAGDGVWIVSTTHRTIAQPQMEVQLTRPVPEQPEPAPATTSSSALVGGVSASLMNPSSVGGAGLASGGPARAQALYNAGLKMSNMGIPYSQSQRNLVANPPSADCSSSCSWALLNAGFPLPNGVGPGQWAPVSGDFVGWGAPGPGNHFTIHCSPEHIWIQFMGLGPAWRFDTSPWGCGDPNGPRMRNCPRSVSGFTERHWPGL